MKKCVCAALNFYARKHEDLKLENIFRLNGGHEVFIWELDPIISIPDTALIICPSGLQNGTIQKFAFDSLANLSPGFYHPTEKCNNTADVMVF